MSEWWIQDGYALHVINRAQSLLEDYLGITGHVSEVEIKAWLYEDGVPHDEDGDYEDPVNTFLEVHKAEDGVEAKTLPAWADDYKDFESIVFIALGRSSSSTITRYGIETLRWIRVCQKDIECYDYTQLREIVDGLYDTDPELDEDTCYNIEVVSTGCYHTQVAVKDITDLTPRPQRLC